MCCPAVERTSRSCSRKCQPARGDFDASLSRAALSVLGCVNVDRQPVWVLICSRSSWSSKGRLYHLSDDEMGITAILILDHKSHSEMEGERGRKSALMEAKEKKMKQWNMIVSMFSGRFLLCDGQTCPRFTPPQSLLIKTNRLSDPFTSTTAHVFIPASLYLHLCQRFSADVRGSAIPALSDGDTHHRNPKQT